MLNNYFKIAIRNLLRNKVYSFINIFGLSIGIACSILIMLFVKNELSYDSFHKSADNIYRISLFENYAKDEQHFNSITPARIGPALKENFPGVKNAIRYSDMQGQVRYGSKSFPEKYNLADPNFFRMFSFPLIKGDPDDALSSPNSVVLT
ncbi:MAG: ABC transporter permease, partial [Ignavibacteriaceae bacterium]